MTMNYFAYGANMNLKHMKQLCGNHAKVVGPAQLLHYEWGLNKKGFANVYPNQIRNTWGVLFEIDDSALKGIDNFEGYPSEYDRKEDFVVNVFGKTVTAMFYFQADQSFGGKPAEDYITRIIEGAVENNLPREWVTKLEGYKISK